jgi:predicted O-methyltransferase YrrM
MGKLTRAFKALFLIIRNPYLLNHILDEDMNWHRYIIKKYPGCHSLPVIAPETLFGNFSETVSPYASLDGSSLPTDLALLKKLARFYTDCSYFEIGTWRGESVANVASVAKECFTLNLPDDEMRSMGLDERYIRLHRHFSNDLENVTHLQGNSMNFDFASLGRKFDLVFIDGDHHYETVKNDTEKVFRHLVHDHTIVVWHDYAYNPEKIRYEVMAGILDGCPEAHRHQLYHVANTMCAVFLLINPTTRPFESPQKPDGYFELQIRKSC